MNKGERKQASSGGQESEVAKWQSDSVHPLTFTKMIPAPLQREETNYV
jgi:hypothetical protein